MGHPGNYPEQPYRAPRSLRPLLRRWFLTGALAILFVSCGLLLAGIIGAELGVEAAGLATLGALVPLGVVVPSLLWLDRYEAEPRSNLWIAFLWGTLVATTVSLVLNTGSLALLESVSRRSEDIGAVIVAPVVEETLKGLGIVLILVLHRREFDGIVDGIVYAGLTAAGFAFAENVFYLGRGVIEGGTEGLVGVFILRCILGPFAHPLFTACLGVGVGVAVHTASTLVRVLAPAAGLVCGMILHSLWNLSAVVGIDGFFARYLLLQLPIIVAAMLFAGWARRREGRLIGAYLGDYVKAGWLTDLEVRMLAALPARREARAWARGVGGQAGERAMRDFQDDGSELALLRMRIAHGTAPESALWEERALLERIRQSRAAYLRPVRP